MSIVYMYMYMGRLFCMPYANFMQTLRFRATVYCASNVQRSCLHVINYMFWHSATRNVSEHVLQHKTLSNFRMASASVDVAILQLKGQICASLLG